MTVKEELKDLGYALRESDNPDRQEIDFDIVDDDGDIVATVWGDKPEDVDWECRHPYGLIEFGDDRDEQGECLLCGSFCDWHYQAEWLDEGHDEEGRCIGRMVEVRTPHEWYPRRDVGGLIGKYLEELKG